MTTVMVSVESAEGLQRRMKVEVPAERVEGEIDKRLKDMSRRARIKGFRPGKAPLKVIRQQFGPQVREEVVTEVLRESWIAAINEQKLRPVGMPQIEEHSAEKGAGLSFTAVFEVFPEIQLGSLEGLAVEQPTAEVSPADVDAMLAKLRRQRAEWHEVDRQAGDGDRVVIDFDGEIDGEPFPGGTGNEVGVVLGEGRMLSDFEAGLNGLAAGDERNIEVEFPEDYGSADVAGKKAVFKVKARKVEEQRLPDIDEEFCKAFGVEEGGIDRLRAEVEENMREERDKRVRELLKRQVLDKLVAAHEFEVPNALVEQEIESLRQDMARRINPNADPDNPQLPPREPFEKPARFRVALGLLIGEIVRERQLKVDPARIQKHLQEIGERYGDIEAVTRVYMNNRELMGQLETAALEEQVVDLLLEKADRTERQLSFDELMNPEQA